MSSAIFRRKFPLFELLLENGFVDYLEFSEAELRRKKLKTNSGVFELVAKPFNFVSKNLRAVERQRR